MKLRDKISWLKDKIQADLFPYLKECLSGKDRYAIARVYVEVGI